ncbi:hypothetical protein KI387_028506, partial [Taxus chinensis]
PEDLRIPFERFGPVKDVYLPRNYYTGEPRGFGFVKYRNPDDAAEAKYHMNHQIIGGREITIVFAEENRKNPQEMRANARHGRSSRYGEGGFRRRSPPHSPRRRRHSYSRSPSPPKRGSRGHGAQEDYYSDARSFSRSPIARSESRSPRAADVRRPIARSESRTPRAPDVRRPIARSESRSPRAADVRRPIVRNESRSPRTTEVRSLRRASSPIGNGRSPMRRQMLMQASR